MSGERALLQRLIAGPVSGDTLARENGETRAAVWKRIEGLREAGVAIEARAGRGYALAQPLDLLDADAIMRAMPDAARAQLAGLEVAWSIDSTSSELLRREAPRDGVAVLLAERQTDGRGRRGRNWASPLAANLYLSLARGFDGGLARLGGLSLVAGVAATEALRTLGLGDVRLKWPNDLVVVEGDRSRPNPGHALRKLGGLLVEGSGEHAGPVRAVIGLGLNVRMPAAHGRAIDQPWIDLATLAPGRLPSRSTVAAALLAALLPALEQFDRDGLPAFLPRHGELDALAGRSIVLHGGDGDRAGTALGLAPDGALRVRLDDGQVRAFHAGEVSVRPR
ncbi:biotin--[acetyl-CoA-carboxylase] ligase [Luteimonas sp. 22616]|uniref:biotin--[acetyl-CoA-carboxylase] ligase n=1 Tax=Luteimonas sp. 22616 TaxID=3453951 RepID=UPI003F873CA8